MLTGIASSIKNYKNCIMKKFINISTLLLAMMFGLQQTAMASSHREAPLISNDPLADNTDLYAFKSPSDPEKIILIANYIPFEHPAGGPNWYTFGTNIRYEIHIDNQTATTGDDIIYRFTFQQTNEDATTFLISVWENKISKQLILANEV